MQFGIYFPPGRHLDRGTESGQKRDLMLLEYLDKLGFDYAWFAESHLEARQTNPTHEEFISIATKRTHKIKIGTGVAQPNSKNTQSLANQVMRLSNINKSRVVFGAGPGFLAPESSNIGISNDQFDSMVKSIKAVKSLSSIGTISEKSIRFSLSPNEPENNSFSAIEFAIASHSSPIAAVLAGTFGLGMLSLGAFTAGGFSNLSSIWEIYQRKAKANGFTDDRSRWSLAVPMHLAKSHGDAQHDVRFGSDQWIRELQTNRTFLSLKAGNGAKQIIENGLGVIGTPKDAINKIRELEQKSGGFGCILLAAHQWADLEETKQSYKMFSDHVINAI